MAATAPSITSTARRISFFMANMLPGPYDSERGAMGPPLVQKRGSSALAHASALSTGVVASRLEQGGTVPPEVSGDLVASPAFKAGGTGAPRPAGSIPVHLRQGGAG